MAEKGTLVNIQAGGESIAAWDAVETDESANARYIQRIDLATGHIPSPKGSAIRAAVTVADPLDVPNIPAEVITNLIDCGDKKTLIVEVEFAISAVNNVEIVPLVFDDEVTPGLISSFNRVTFQVTASSPSQNTDGTQAISAPNQVTWDIKGASRIGILAPGGYFDGNTATVWAWVV